jgi:RNA polymerase sigma-70 factor (ECF subfamily)
MTANNAEHRLSKIETLWALVRQAHQGSADGVREAQKQLLERYGGAVHRYLLGALRNEHAADDLYQEFCVRFLQGAFKDVDPGRGRFRDYVKTCLYHLIVDHQRRQKKRHGPLDADVPDPATELPAEFDSDREFLASWREELLDRAWLSLEETERETGQPHHTVLRLRKERPEADSTDLAPELSLLLGRKISAENWRGRLKQARDLFADVLLQEVIRSLEDPQPDRLYQELADLELLSYCQAALKRRGLDQRGPTAP